MGRSLHQFQVDLPEPRTTVPSFSAIWLYDDSGIFDGRKPYDLRRSAETGEDVGLIFRANSSSYFQVLMLYCSCDTTSYIFWPLGEDTLVKSVFLSLLISLSVLRLCRSNEGSSLFRVRSFNDRQICRPTAAVENPHIKCRDIQQNIKCFRKIVFLWTMI